MPGSNNVQQADLIGWSVRENKCKPRRWSVRPGGHHRITASLHHDSNVAVNALRPTKWREVRFVVLVRLPRAELRHVVPWAQTLS